jgi:hypothetical protein
VIFFVPRTSFFILLGLTLFVGCDREVSSRDESGLQIGRRPKITPVSSVVRPSSSIRHDLGHQLAEGQTIRHAFSITNPGTNPVKLLSSQASVPCCSAVEPFTVSEIGSGGSASVDVVFRPGMNSGAKFLKFFIQTNDPTRPVIELILTADLHPRWQFQQEDRSPRSATVGKSQRRFYRVICHAPSGQQPEVPARLSRGQGTSSLYGWERSRRRSLREDSPRRNP